MRQLNLLDSAFSKRTKKSRVEYSLEQLHGFWESMPMPIDWQSVEKILTSAIVDKQQKHRERVKVEGKFGEGKRKYQLDLIKAKRSDTSISWISSVFFVMNIAHLLRVIFLSFFAKTYFGIKMIKKIKHCLILWMDSRYLQLELVTF